MKADVWQQHSLVELTALDAEIGRLDHRAKNLAEQQALDAVAAEHQEASDKLAVVGISLEDLDGEVAKYESEIASVRQREDRDRSMLQSGNVNSKQLTDLQHELETLERRQASLEDDQLEVMERREQVQEEQAAQQRRVDELREAVAAARAARDEVLVTIDAARQKALGRRAEITEGIDAALLAAYDRQRANGGPGAGLLQARRCGACRIEIDRADMARMSGLPEDEVLRCPECNAILLRQPGSFA
ncbi:zinc ribbon domain-containing protein [Mycolicibacterium sp. GCM10028919]|uniref:zinc ribbon domain-containing protein n=1 Tax=Mycolicibacterium sp. GCM10028919 TaxID=3273401 RepID=UPI00360AE8A0